MKRLALVPALLGLLTATLILAQPAVSVTAAVVPIRAAFDYNWYPETEQWASQYTPSAGHYDSSDPATLSRQVTQAKAAGLDAFITSWWGQGSKTDLRLPLALTAAAAQGFHLAPYYEKEGNGTPPSLGQLKQDFTYLYALSASPGWLRVGGKPVLFVYNALASQSTCATVTKLLGVNAGRFYLNLKVFSGYRACSSQPDSWHQYGPASAIDSQKPYAVSVSPGFYKWSESAPRLVRDLTRFKANLATQVASGAQWQLITTWNEWGEGTSVEPGTLWGTSYLDAMDAAYTGVQPPPTTTATKTTTSTATTTATTPKPPPGTVTKALVFVEENHSLNEMKAGMPYLASQALEFGYASNYSALSHPSLPNYLALAGGSTFGVTDDAGPSTHPIAGASIFASGAKSYQESMTSNCMTTGTGAYAVKHNPWAYFTDERAQCLGGDVPSGTYNAGNLHNDIVNGDLPTIGEVTPNLDNDAHDGSLATADAWLHNWLTLIYASPDWRSGHLAVIVTADEDDSSQGNKVLTVVIHPSQQGHVVTAALNHYSLTRYLTDLAGAPCLRSACTASDFGAAFGL